MLSGLTSRTFEHLQLGAGLFLKQFDPDAAATLPDLRRLLTQAIAGGTGLLGATRGGGSFQCKPALRQVEADGLRAPVRGGTVNDGWTVKLTGTLLEITPDSFSDALACVDKTVQGGVTTLRPRLDLRSEDYIPRLCWVGDTAKGLMLIELTHALNLSGQELPDRTIVPLSVDYRDNIITVHSDQDNVNTTLAYQDIFTSGQPIRSLHNHLHVQKGETVIRLHYPHWILGLIVTVLGLFCTVCFLLDMRTRERMNRAVANAAEAFRIHSDPS